MNIDARCQLQKDDFRLDLDISIPGQGVTALFGASGVGKSTTLRWISGLERAGGYLKVGDQVWQDDTQKIFVPTHQRSLAYVFQDVSLFPHLSVRDNLLYGYKRINQEHRKIRPEEAIDWLGIAALLDRRPDQLSGGQKQRVAIARALLTSPDLILMDEPLSGLDQASKQEIMPYLESLQQRLATPMIYVSHYLDEVARLADFLVLIEDGTATVAPLVDMLTRLDLPLAQTDHATAILDTVVSGHDEPFGLTALTFDGGSVLLPRADLKRGREVRICIHARDVSISLSPASDTSILNVLSAEVEEIQPLGESLTMVRLAVGSHHLLSSITRKSAQRLKLKVGTPVFAQIKSVATIE